MVVDLRLCTSAISFEQLENRELLAVDTYVFQGVVELAREGVIDFTQVGEPVTGRIATTPGDPSSILSFELGFGATGFTCSDLEVDFGTDETFITSDCENLRDVYLSLGWNGTEFLAGDGYVGQETEVDCGAVPDPFRWIRTERRLGRW